MNKNYLNAVIINTFLESLNNPSLPVKGAHEVFADIETNKFTNPTVDESIKELGFVWSEAYVEDILNRNRRIVPFTAQDILDADNAGIDILVFKSGINDSIQKAESAIGNVNGLRIEKAKKGSPQYEVWLRKYREKRGKKQDDLEGGKRSKKEDEEGKELKNVVEESKGFRKKEDSIKSKKEDIKEILSDSKHRKSDSIDNVEEENDKMLSSGYSSKETEKAGTSEDPISSSGIDISKLSEKTFLSPKQKKDTLLVQAVEINEISSKLDLLRDGESYSFEFQGDKYDFKRAKDGKAVGYRISKNGEPLINPEPGAAQKDHSVFCYYPDKALDLATEGRVHKVQEALLSRTGKGRKVSDLSVQELASLRPGYNQDLAIMRKLVTEVKSIKPSLTIGVEQPVKIFGTVFNVKPEKDGGKLSISIFSNDGQRLCYYPDGPRVTSSEMDVAGNTKHASLLAWALRTAVSTIDSRVLDAS